MEGAASSASAGKGWNSAAAQDAGMGVPAPSRGSLGPRLSLFPGLERSRLLGEGEADPPAAVHPQSVLCLGQLGGFSLRGGHKVLSLISLPVGCRLPAMPAAPRVLHPTPPQLAPISSVSAVSSEKCDLIFTGSPPSRTQRWSHTAQPMYFREVVK